MLAAILGPEGFAVREKKKQKKAGVWGVLMVLWKKRKTRV